VGEEETSEIGVQSLVPRDQLVGEGQTGHQTTLLQPEDGSLEYAYKWSASTRQKQSHLRLTKDPEKKIPSTAAKAISRSAKVDLVSEIHLRAQSAFLAIQGTDSIATRSVYCSRSGRQSRLLTSINGVKQVGPSCRVLDVSVDEQRVGFRVDVLPERTKANDQFDFKVITSMHNMLTS
jgi:hypothetical protein